MNYLSFFSAVFVVAMFSVKDLEGQSMEGNPYYINDNICFVDTLIIRDPILIKFREFQDTETKTHIVLVSKSYLDSISISSSMKYEAFLCSKDGDRKSVV